MPRKKAAEAIEAFGRWNDEVARVIQEINNNGYAQRGEVDLRGPRVYQMFDYDLYDAYTAITPWLKPVPRLYKVPEYVPYLRNFSVNTAHLALTSFLNPPERLYCAKDALQSDEYLTIERRVWREFEATGLNPPDWTCPRKVGARNRASLSS